MKWMGYTCMSHRIKAVRVLKTIKHEQVCLLLL